MGPLPESKASLMLRDNGCPTIDWHAGWGWSLVRRVRWIHITMATEHQLMDLWGLIEGWTRICIEMLKVWMDWCSTTCVFSFEWE